MFFAIRTQVANYCYDKLSPLISGMNNLFARVRMDFSENFGRDGTDASSSRW